MTRLARFREYMARMNPVRDPEQALDLYVEPPEDRSADDIAARFELEPACAQVLVGGVGSGKTTEVLRAVKRLEDANSDILAAYIDVTKFHKLEESLDGVLVSLVARAVLRVTSAKPEQAEQSAMKKLRELSEGVTEWIHPGDSFVASFQRSLESLPGGQPRMTKVTRPSAIVPPSLGSRFAEYVQPLKTTIEPFIGSDHLVFAFDGLDRLSTAHFQTAVRDDIVTLKAAGIGVLVVAPGGMAFGERTTLDLFDKVVLRRAFDPRVPAMRSFLEAIVTRRAPAGALTSGAIDRICRGSGGFLRDLLALAKDAGEAAYVAGHEMVEEADAEKAVGELGRSLAFGLSDQEMTILSAVAKTKRLVVRGEVELALIDKRALATQRDGTWSVHPALLGVLTGAGLLDLKAS